METRKAGTEEEPGVSHLMYQTEHEDKISIFNPNLVFPDIHDQEKLSDESSIVEAHDEAGAEVEDEAVDGHNDGWEWTKHRSCSRNQPAVQDEEMN